MTLRPTALAALALLAAAAPALAQPAPVALTLPDAVDRARRANPDLQALAARVRLQAANVRVTLARVLPTLSANTTYTRYDQGVSLGESVVVQEDEVTTNANLAVPVFRPGALGDYLVADKELEAARAETGRFSEDLLLGVVTLYIEVERARALLATAQDTAERRQAFLTAAEARLAGGLTDRSEVQRARLSLLEAQGERDAAQGRLEVAQGALAVVLGLPAQTPVETTTPADPAGPGPIPAELAPGEGLPLAAAPDVRGDVRALELLLERDRLARRWTWLSFLPDVDVVAGLSQGPPSFRDPDGFNWQIQLRGTFLLFDGGARYGRLDAAEASRALHEAQLEALRLTVSQEEHAARARVEALEAQLATALEGVEIAAQYRADVMRRLEAGFATLLDVLDAEAQLATADARQRTLAHDLAIERWRLVHARGALIEALATVTPRPAAAAPQGDDS